VAGVPIGLRHDADGVGAPRRRLATAEKHVNKFLDRVGLRFGRRPADTISELLPIAAAAQSR
jgi:hypothetical protein